MTNNSQKPKKQSDIERLNASYSYLPQPWRGIWVTFCLLLAWGLAGCVMITTAAVSVLILMALLNLAFL